MILVKNLPVELTENHTHIHAHTMYVCESVMNVFTKHGSSVSCEL